ncbi:MAG: hypothetical protein ACK41E_05270 [Deinococcales bacterium]
MNQITHPQAARYTVSSYHKMLEAGIFPDGVKTELIDGEVYLMPHPKAIRRQNRHAARVSGCRNQVVVTPRRFKREFLC